MSFANHIVSSAVLAGAVFAIATFPLAANGAKPMTVQLDGDTVFSGAIREAAPPYLSIAAALGIGAGVTNLAVAGWRHASRKLAIAEDQANSLSRQLQTQTAQLEQLQFSPSKLEGLGLREFLHTNGSALETTIENGSVAARSVAELHPVAPRAAVAVAPLPEHFSTALSDRQTLDRHPPVLPPDIASGRSHEHRSPESIAQPPLQQPFSANKITPAEITPAEVDLNNPAQVNALLSNLKQVVAQLEQINHQP